MDSQPPSLIENKIKHLCRVANRLTHSPLSNILKSYYLTKCRMLTLSGTVSLPQQFSKSTVRCTRCCVEYSDGPVAYKIQSAKKKRFVAKLIKKHENGQSLTRYQNTYLKHMLKKGEVDTHNTMAITCGVCKHETKEELTKPLQLNFAPEETTEVRKKKKKKDRFSGLDKSAVLSATPQNKTYKTNNFVPLESTPLKTGTNKDIGHRNKQTNNNSKRNEIEMANKKRKIVKENQKQSKALSKILNNSQPSKSRSNALKLFLTSI